jgi:hypothetical protein
MVMTVIFYDFLTKDSAFLPLNRHPELKMGNEGMHNDNSRDAEVSSLYAVKDLTQFWVLMIKSSTANKSEILRYTVPD